MIESAAQHENGGRDRASGGRHLRCVTDGSSRGPSTVEEVWDHHGTSLYTLACALLGDEAAATQAVTLAMADLARSADGWSTTDVRATLVRGVYEHSQAIVDLTPRTLDLPPAMAWLERVAPLQRACLALCLFGGLTHRQAADLIDVPSATVAELLTAGLKELGGVAVDRTVTALPTHRLGH
ncbi:RNA polymerase sigma factor [Nocardioides piscis]|uniref:RNA polymerase sigma factor 70 region 4 type 2 domain-containing protein n=1 Tax=Nocardioides piscis TaxID=2714938 RepID=A0A6G7YHK4_9ACTN|nr:sigma-70 region 4 domain-containing protein [Nocardioides piscis]QIK76111.1 hypothetical protein G7071_12405 [Nocardioides piscis]